MTNLFKDSVNALNDVIPFSALRVANLTPPKEERPIKQAVPKRFGGEDDSILSKWWFWGIVGGVAALGGVLLFTDIAKGNPSYNTIRIK